MSSAQMVIHARITREPQRIVTKSGKAMASASVALDLPGRGGQTSIFVDVIAFGELADDLLRHCVGDYVAAMGELQRHVWNDSKTGEEREKFQVIARQIISARAIRSKPGQGKRDKPALAAAMRFQAPA